MGNPYSIYMVDECYYFGNGVEKDLEEATVWFQKAMDLDYTPTEKEQKRIDELLGTKE